MSKIFWSFFVFSLYLVPCQLAAQPGSSAEKVYKEAKVEFMRQLKQVSSDSVIVHPLARSFDSEVASIYKSIISNASLSTPEMEKAVRSLAYFMKELSKNMALQKADIYDIPGALQSYKDILTALINHKPLSEIMVAPGPRRSQVLASAFSQYKEYALLDDIAVYKRMASSPEFILQFLENKQGFRFEDSLLLSAAAHDPMKLVAYLNREGPGVQEKIRNTRNIYLQQIVALSKEKNVTELLPFLTQLAENKISPAEIIEKRADVAKYFQLMVDAMKESASYTDSSSIFLKPLRNGIRQKSLAFYVNQVNDLHNAEDAVRFASVKGLRPEDLYYIITNCGDELYTSSYLGLYKRLMDNFKTQNADSLFTIVKYDNFQIFMRLAANYNVLDDFLRKMPREQMAALLKQFIGGIESNSVAGLERAMDIADSFTGLGEDAEIIDLIQNELQSNLSRSKSGQQFLGIRLYGILLQVFELVKQKDGLNKLWGTLGNYDILKRAALEDKGGEIVQLVLFYGDEDGVASFNNFSKLYADSSKWRSSKNANWVAIESLSDRPIIIYANRPLDMELELDLRAQDSLVAFLQQQSHEPSVLIHRGHSYHLDKTLKRLQPSVKLAILGSCGGYNGAISIANINPDAQIIVSKKTGSKFINDPMIDVINDNLVEGNDLVWAEIWRKLAARFSKDEFALSLFNEYLPPNKNVSLFVLKLFNYYNRFV